MQNATYHCKNEYNKLSVFAAQKNNNSHRLSPGGSLEIYIQIADPRAVHENISADSLVSFAISHVDQFGEQAIRRPGCALAPLSVLLLKPFDRQLYILD
jgi:hypothetical protein